MHKNATKCNKTQSKWCINKHGALKIIDTFETYHRAPWLLPNLATTRRAPAVEGHNLQGRPSYSDASPQLTSTSIAREISLGVARRSCRLAVYCREERESGDKLISHDFMYYYLQFCTLVIHKLVKTVFISDRATS
jgi:hypothetical protein